MKKKEMIPLTKKEEKMHNKQKVCHICKERLSTDDGKKKQLLSKIQRNILENTEVPLMISAI